jgi:hypothetical protein
LVASATRVESPAPKRLHAVGEYIPECGVSGIALSPDEVLLAKVLDPN